MQEEISPEVHVQGYPEKINATEFPTTFETDPCLFPDFIILIFP